MVETPNEGSRCEATMKKGTLLAFEIAASGDELEIHGSESGISELISILNRVVETKGHEHLMTPSWGGTELSEERQGGKSVLINKVTIRVW